MIVAVLAFAVAMQQPLTRDSAAVARLFTSLRGADSAVCELAGRALTNFGGWWGANGDLPMPMPMPMPMPIPMPMPFADGGIHVNPSIHGVGWRRKADAVALGAFRLGLRDSSRCVRHIAARVLGNAKPPWAYQTFTSMAKDSDAGFRETGILGLGELEDIRSLGGLSEALADRETRVRAMAAWALGELEDSRAIEPLKRVLGDGSPTVRGRAVWALGSDRERRGDSGVGASPSGSGGRRSPDGGLGHWRNRIPSRRPGPPDGLGRRRLRRPSDRDLGPGRNRRCECGRTLGAPDPGSIR